MGLGTLLPWLVVALVAFIALRFVIGAIKSSMRMMMLAVILIVVLGGGYLWYSGQLGGGAADLPVLSVPAP